MYIICVVFQQLFEGKQASRRMEAVVELFRHDSFGLDIYYDHQTSIDQRGYETAKTHNLSITFYM